MDKTVTHYAYIYIEMSHGDHPYLMHENLSLELKADIAAAFRDHGGINIMTDVNVEKRITTVWKTVEGYREWLTDERVKPYIELRDDYNRQYKITAMLSGPYHHVFTEKKENDK